MPAFPFNFPYIFGEIPAASQTLNVVATSTAVVSVQRYADCSLSVTATASASGSREATGEALLGVVALSGGSLSRETYGAVQFDISTGVYTDSQELGFAESDTVIIAGPTAEMSRDQPISSSLSALVDTAVDGLRDATISAYLETTADNTGHYGDPTAIVPTKFDYLIDKFNTKDTSLWSGWTGGVDVSNGVLVMPVSGGGSIFTTGNINTGAGIYDLTESSITFHLIQPPNTDDSTPYTRFEVTPQYSTLDSSNQSAIRLDYVAGSWKLRQADESGVFGSPTTATYSTAGGWIRIRISNGMLYWDTSVDGIGWTATHEETLVGSGYHSASVEISVDPGSSTDAGTAIWDQFNDVPRTIQATPLAILAITSSVISRDQLIDAEIAVEASESAENRYDAAAQSELALTALMLSEIMRTMYLDSEFSIAADGTGDVTEYGVGDADTQVVAAASGEIVSDQIVSAVTDIVMQSFASVLRQVYADTATDILADGYASLRATYPASAFLAAYAFPTAVAIRNARVAGSLAATISSSPEGTEFGIADAALTITGTGSGAMSLNQNFEALTGAFVTLYAAISAQRLITASLAANAWHTVTADEPFAIVLVKRDDRTGIVRADPRRAVVRAESRVLTIPQAARQTT